MDSLRAVPRQERSSRAIGTILEAAERLTASVGLEELSIAQVAKEAGVSPGKVYYWFEDKHALIGAVRARTHERFLAFVPQMLQAVDIPDASGLVDHYVRHFAAYMLKNPTALELLDQPRSAGEDPFRRLMTDQVMALLARRVTDIEPEESRAVSENLVNVMIVLTADVVAAARQKQEDKITEMVYLLYAYLHSRYPHAKDQVWGDPDHPLRPARSVDGGLPRSRPLNPADFAE